ncbi:MAG: hypothetical protein IIA40_11510, partial [SAR324 cluster bacterium]|nr:hypothetical protein [SAR324 cluster bacterium]
MALYGNTTITGDVETEYDKAWAEDLYNSYWDDLQPIKLVAQKRVRNDLFTWRRGSAQMVLKVNPALNNLSIYSVLATGVHPSTDLYRHLLHYNILQRRESLGLFEKGGKLYIVLKYTMELELVTNEVLQRHILAMQEIADQLDTELVNQFGGALHFNDWDRLDQSGVDDLLEIVSLVAEVEELSANPNAPAIGTVIEAQLEVGRGPVATVIVQRGTLEKGAAVASGTVAGRVRAMYDENGEQLTSAGPSTPVLVTGWDDVPQAGDMFQVVNNERTARKLATAGVARKRAAELLV